MVLMDTGLGHPEDQIRTNQLLRVHEEKDDDGKSLAF